MFHTLHFLFVPQGRHSNCKEPRPQTCEWTFCGGEIRAISAKWGSPWGQHKRGWNMSDLPSPETSTWFITVHVGWPQLPGGSGTSCESAKPEPDGYCPGDPDPPESSAVHCPRGPPPLSPPAHADCGPDRSTSPSLGLRGWTLAWLCHFHLNKLEGEEWKPSTEGSLR